MAKRFAACVLTLASLLGACSSGKEAGIEGEPCYGNGTCKPGLVCLSSLCVRPGGSDAAESSLDASRVLPDVGTSVPPDVAATVAPDVAATSAPDAAVTVVPDVAATVVPDVAVTVVPDVAANVPGSLSFEVNCEGDGCGKTGVLLVAVKDCGPGGTAVASNQQAGVTLSAGTPVRGEIGQLAPGALCLTVYLDVDASGSRTPGDVVSSQEETPATVVSGLHATVSLGLGLVVPGGMSAIGSVTFNVSCQDDACGKAGELFVTAKSCGAAGTAVGSIRQTGVTLMPGAPVTGQIGQLAPGALCLTVYLDVDASGSRTPGDVVSSRDEIPVTVVSGQDATVSIDLGALVPGGLGRVTAGWTVNGGDKCPINGGREDTGMVQLTVAGVSGQPTRCSQFVATLTVASGSNLPITLALTDSDHPGETATATGTVTIVAGQVAGFGPVDINCSFCPP